MAQYFPSVYIFKLCVWGNPPIIQHDENMEAFWQAAT